MTSGADLAAEQAGTRLFDTAIGRCGVAWRGEAIVGVQIPERSDQATLAALRAKLGTAGRRSTGADKPSPAVAAAIKGIVGLLDGGHIDLNFVDIDVGPDASPFDAAVWEVTRSIPPGASMTYGQVAERIGEPGAARAVGRALGANPCPIVVPCHRVMGADGRLVGFSANGGTETKRRMLLIERCPAVAPTLFDL